VFLLDVNVVPITALPLVVRRDARRRRAVRRSGGRLGSFLRVATNRRVFEVPTPRTDAFAFIEATCAQPRHVRIAPGPRHLAILRRLCDEADAMGDLVPDAVIGAIAVEYSCELITLDRDFARFISVRHRRPPDL
jgi:toxin-antitoxin system PIN domain toxin